MNRLIQEGSLEKMPRGNGDKYVSYKAFTSYVEKIGEFSSKISLIANELQQIKRKLQEIELKVSEISEMSADVSYLKKQVSQLETSQKNKFREVEGTYNDLRKQIDNTKDATQKVGFSTLGWMKWVIIALIPLLLTQAYVLLRVVLIVNKL